MTAWSAIVVVTKMRPNSHRRATPTMIDRNPAATEAMVEIMQMVKSSRDSPSFESAPVRAERRAKSSRVVRMMLKL